MTDTKTLLNALAEQNPSTAQKGLRNIMNGVHANDTVNVDDAKDIGQGILASMTGTFVTEFAFKRSNQAETLATRSSVKCDREKIQVDPQLLFQRLIVAFSSLSCVAIHLLSLILRLCCSNHISQPLLMLFGI